LGLEVSPLLLAKNTLMVTTEPTGQSSKPLPRWESAQGKNLLVASYSPSDEIEEYGQWVAKTHGLYNYFRLEHEVVSCVWAEAESKWLVKVRGPDGKEFIDKADLLINGSGILNNWKWPDIAGRESFKGTMIHSARWDPNVSFDGKRVGIVGVGATAVQIIPNLQPRTSLSCFVIPAQLFS
jgi:cation diffusion facilitator CzcD-associated flavoprotein CzcO